MNPYLNDTDFQARHARYQDMLRAAQANIELRRGELHLHTSLFSRAAALAVRLFGRLRYGQLVMEAGRGAEQVHQPNI